ncbi:MAG: hypothetical protein K0V04_18370 [Deltaproteobacteria bacterium]|nr:hypothetical protein [Deltaproteobacteria bacterium]
MPAHDDAKSLLSDFEPVTDASWGERVQQTLDGPLSSLDAPSLEGPTIQALYTAQEGEPGPRPPARVPGWSIALAYAGSDSDALIEAVRGDATRGLEVAWIEQHGDRLAGARAPAEIRGATLGPAQVPALVEAAGPGVAVHIHAGLGAPALATALLDARGKGGPDDAVLCDPLATLASTGGLGTTLDEAYRDLARTTADAASRGSSLRTVLADAVPAHDAGASAEQEIATAIAAGIGHLQGMADHGLGATDVMPRMVLRLATGSDVLIEVAKLRAVARLWARVRAHAGADGGAATPVTVRTSFRAATRRDPWVNLLRGTVGGVAAIVGGASVLAVQPFTEAVGLPDAPARRWAINTQHILRGESHLGAVDDPAAGSWAFESVTDALARGAWAIVQRWLAAGGLAHGLATGVVQAEIAERAAARSQAHATLAQLSTGTSIYPLLDEPAVSVEADVAAPRLETTAIVAARPLARRRVTEPFETLRDRGDAITAKLGARPRALLVAVGAPGRARAQIDFARSFCGIAGFDVVMAEPGHEPSDVAVAIACGPAGALAEDGVAAVRRCLAAGAPRVLVAGRPTPALRDAGVHDFVHRGRDVVTLATSLQTLSAPAASEQS